MEHWEVTKTAPISHSNTKSLQTLQRKLLIYWHRQNIATSHLPFRMRKAISYFLNFRFYQNSLPAKQRTPSLISKSTRPYVTKVTRVTTENVFIYRITKWWEKYWNLFKISQFIKEINHFIKAYIFFISLLMWPNGKWQRRMWRNGKNWLLGFARGLLV